MENEALIPLNLGGEGTNDTSATVEEGGDIDGAAETSTPPAPEAEIVARAQETTGGDDGQAETAEAETTDFGELLRSDLAVLSRRFPGIFASGSVEELPNAERYGELREAGLSPVEAFCASHHESLFARQETHSNRAHLDSCVPRTARPAADRMSVADLAMARSLFPSLPDSEIEGLYRRVGHGKRH